MVFIVLISISLAFVACDKNDGDLLPEEPQEHNSKRDTQTMPDTDRFIGESVPAINSEIAKQTFIPG